MKKNVLGVNVDDVNMIQALNIVEGWLSKKDKHYIVTPNPEIVVMAQEDEELRKIINNADLAIPDGVGLNLSGDIVCNIPGIELMEALIKMASENGFTTSFLGGRGEVAEKASERLQKKYPKLKISFAQSGGEVDKDGNTTTNYQSLDFARDKLPTTNLLFVAFGPPKQEKWIAKNLANLDVKVTMGVGGSFDYFSGKIPRAPRWIRDLGFEWLFRLIVQPWRIKRQLALLKYLWLLSRK